MLFLPLTMGIYKIGGALIGHRFKNVVLLLASLLFYAWGEPLFIFMLILGIGVNYVIGLKIEETLYNKKIFLML